VKLTAACAFGLEALVKRELIALGYEPKVSQPGRIDFEGDWQDVCRANIWLRTADRVLIQVQQFECPDFDALFDTIKEFDWSTFIPRDAEFPVVGKSRLSTLTSVPAVQRTVKKALVKSLQHFHGTNALPESGDLYKVEIALLKDVATVTIDTTGPSLHKRGYRRLVAEAPIKETLAAAMVDLTVWRPGRALIDPFCGSGTIAIEAAMIGMNIAPGIKRDFSSSQWNTIGPTRWHEAIEEAMDLQRPDTEMQINGYDQDSNVLGLARHHAEQAGVANKIHFQQQSFDQLQSSHEHGCVVTNPPYGERLEDQEQLLGLYESIPGIMERLPTWSLYIITNMPRFEELINQKATRRRKLFNGRLECTYYQYLGPKPPRKKWDNPEQTGSASTEAT
jgi:putative N6-adenine-specific DNA methylase